MNIIKVSKKKLAEHDYKGTFLYEKKGEYYFNDRWSHSLFVSGQKVDKTGMVEIGFNEYIQRVFEVCAGVKNKPSLLFINCAINGATNTLNSAGKNYERKYKLFLDSEMDDDKWDTFNSEPCLVGTTQGLNGIANTLKRLVETRNVGIPKNDVFVFFNEPESFDEFMVPTLSTFITLGGSRRIHFVVNIKDKAQFIETFGEEYFQIIDALCPTKF